MKIYVLSYSQNGYQRERIKIFLRNLSLEEEILNPDLELKDSSFEQAQRVFVILGGSQFFMYISKEEQETRKRGLDIKYFKINHFGRYFGRVKGVNRKVLAIN